MSSLPLELCQVTAVLANVCVKKRDQSMEQLHTPMEEELFLGLVYCTTRTVSTLRVQLSVTITSNLPSGAAEHRAASRSELRPPAVPGHHHPLPIRALLQAVRRSPVGADVVS